LPCDDFIIGDIIGDIALLLRFTGSGIIRIIIIKRYNYAEYITAKAIKERAYSIISVSFNIIGTLLELDCYIFAYFQYLL